jgi:hypothetical protein
VPPLFFNVCRFSPETAAADDEDDELPEEEDIEIATLNKEVYRKSSPFLKDFERNLCHNWTTDGKHLSFKEYSTFQNDMRKLLGYVHTNGTGHRILAFETANYKKFCDKPDEAKGVVFLVRPNMQAQYNLFHESKVKLQQIHEEPNDGIFLLLRAISSFVVTLSIVCIREYSV